jgi:integrase
VLCGLRSGLRLSELLALDWADLDERAATLTIERALVRGQLGTPKNHHRRVVDVSSELLQALRVYRRALRAFALKHGRPAPSIMFPAVGGVERLDESNVRKVFTRLCTAANVRPGRRTICGTPSRVSSSPRMRPCCMCRNSSDTGAPPSR